MQRVRVLYIARPPDSSYVVTVWHLIGSQEAIVSLFYGIRVVVLLSHHILIAK